LSGFILALAFALAIESNPMFLQRALAEEAVRAETGPFAALAGWWGGQGRLSFKDGKLEQVKCRATYFVEAGGNELKQTIRCASGSGKVELTSNVTQDAGKLAGNWTETVYNIVGDISGEVTPRGFRVAVKGKETSLSANMEIIVRDKKQIIEIQFFSETLVGLTLILDKG
jgi:hypothetical protein